MTEEEKTSNIKTAAQELSFYAQAAIQDLNLFLSEPTQTSRRKSMIGNDFARIRQSVELLESYLDIGYDTEKVENDLGLIETI